MSYINQQNQLYLEKEDPWNVFYGPRRKINDQYYRIIMGTIPFDMKYIVDIGCGLGRLVDMINTEMKDKTAIGVDSSPICIENTKKRYPSYHFEVGDIRTWRPHEKMDMVLSTGSYYHFEKDERLEILHHIRDYLALGSLLLVAYGWDIHLNGKNTECYPDLSKEIFSVFKPHQVLRYQIIDNTNKEDGSWVFYIGEK